MRSLLKATISTMAILLAGNANALDSTVVPIYTKEGLHVIQATGRTPAYYIVQKKNCAEVESLVRSTIFLRDMNVPKEVLATAFFAPGAYSEPGSRAMAPFMLSVVDSVYSSPVAARTEALVAANKHKCDRRVGKKVIYLK